MDPFPHEEEVWGRVVTGPALAPCRATAFPGGGPDPGRATLTRGGRRHCAALVHLDLDFLQGLSYRELLLV